MMQIRKLRRFLKVIPFSKSKQPGCEKRIASRLFLHPSIILSIVYLGDKLFQVFTVCEHYRWIKTIISAVLDWDNEPHPSRTEEPSPCFLKNHIIRIVISLFFCVSKGVRGKQSPIVKKQRKN